VCGWPREDFIPNTFAYAVLAFWPIASLMLFMAMPVRKAVLWTLLGGYLLLPTRTVFDLPGLPSLDKIIIPSISAFFWTVLLGKGKLFSGKPRLVPAILILVFIFSPVFTVIQNREPIMLATFVIPGLTPYDALSLCVRQATLVIPFVLGYYLFGRAEAQREILTALVVAAMIYTIPILIEVRFSPQLHKWIYGFAPFMFAQQMREGGFRPAVFLGHGLLVAIFTAMALTAAIGLAWQRIRIQNIQASVIAAGLFVVLVLCRSAGALVEGVLFGAMLYVLRPRMIVLMLASIAFMLTIYPAVRETGLMPIGAIQSAASSINAERGESLRFRLANEEQLLVKANQKPFFGWGSWGRNQVYESYGSSDFMTTVTDGAWIIAIGTWGWVGYIAQFGLLCYPFWRGVRARRQIGRRSPALALLAILAVNLVDLIPNASLSPLTWLIAGALSGVYAMQAADNRARQSRQSAPVDPEPVAA